MAKPVRVCIYTAICGDYDKLKPQPNQTVECDFLCFTDNREVWWQENLLGLIKTKYRCRLFFGAWVSATIQSA